MKTVLTLIGIVVLVWGGYAGFTYLKEKPPQFLVKLVTKTDPPPPLPVGNEAPLTVQEGFTVTIFARDIKSARVLTRDPKGTILVSLTQEGKVVALPDLNSDNLADKTQVILEGLDLPHGILVHCPDTGTVSADQEACTLYVAETGALRKYSYDADTYTASNGETIATLPKGEGHYTRTLLMHPDGKRLLISVGSSCNVCKESEDHRATVLAYDIQIKELSVFATGLRNTVFMAIDPVYGEVWGTDNGRDIIGDDIPPDEVNIVTEGKNYGWPYCYGQNVRDTDFDKNGEASSCEAMTPAHIDLQAHSAALGLSFIPEEGWPEDMRNDLLIAYHGSWNRSQPTGYKVVRFNLDAQESRKAEGGPVDFLTGFLKEAADTDSAIGRPVAILAEPGGVAYVSDDRAGAIYRIAVTVAPY